MNFLKPYFPTVTDSAGKVSIRLTVHHAVYFLLLFVLVGAQSVSKFMMSGMEILLAVNWALEWDMRHKFTRDGRLRVTPLLTAFLVMMAVHLLWLIPSDNMAYGWNDLFKKLPLIAIPIVVLTSRPLNRKQITWLFFTFTATVFVATLIGRVRMATIDDLPYREIIPFISHIRFSLNICLAIILSVWFMTRRYNLRRQATSRNGIVTAAGDWLMWVALALLLSLVDFLLRLRSYTAFTILFITSAIIIIVFWRRILNKTIRLTATLLICATVVVAAIVSFTMAHRYYDMIPLATQPLAATTANGNPYTHKDDGLIENGNIINHYICREELEKEWAKRSDKDIYEITQNEYSIYPTLIRYLNAMGTTKDSAGMQLLDDNDVKAIEKGIANPVYLKGSTIEKMCYVMLFEYECHKKTGAVKGFTMAQRMELWHNAWVIFTQNPIFGVGTGDVVDQCHERLLEENSELAGSNKHAHNQYLTFLVSFGLVGFTIIVAVFVWALRKEKIMRLPASVALVCVILISFTTEDTLETLAGCVFSVLFLCLFAVWNRIEDLRNENGPAATKTKTGLRHENEN